MIDKSKIESNKYILLIASCATLKSLFIIIFLRTTSCVMVSRWLDTSTLIPAPVLYGGLLMSTLNACVTEKNM